MKWIGFAVTAGVLALGAAPAFAQTGKCNSIRARCAIEIGGTCDPKTGERRWGYYQGVKYPGNTMMFNECVSRHLAKKNW